MTIKARNRNLNFNAQPDDHDRLDTTCKRLSLTRSEVARRALRIGLAKLEKLTLPGSVHTESQTSSQS
jgi:hypothetical protein